MYCYIEMCFVILGIEYQKILMSDWIDINYFEKPKNHANAAYACCGLYAS